MMSLPVEERKQWKALNYTTYADATAAQGITQPNFLSANLKKMILGAVVGAFLGFGLWFVVAFAAEMKRGKKDSEGEVEQ